MAAYKMAAIKVTPPNDFPLGLIRSHMVVIHLLLMLCDLQRVVSDLVRDLCPTLCFNKLTNHNFLFIYAHIAMFSPRVTSFYPEGSGRKILQPVFCVLSSARRG
jgi:hypothetical protein